MPLPAGNRAGCSMGGITSGRAQSIAPIQVTGSLDPDITGWAAPNSRWATRSPRTSVDGWASRPTSAPPSHPSETSSDP